MIAKKESKSARSSAAESPRYTTRWADSRNWILDFRKPLRAGVRCAFKIKADAKDLSGALIDGLSEYSFSTAGPALLGVAPVYGDIEPEQYFVGLADGEVDLKSIAAKAYFEVEGLPDKVGVKLIQGKDRESVLRAAIDQNWRWENYQKALRAKPARAFSQIKEMETFIVLSAARRFPDRARVVLHWPKGILSKTGLATEEPQQFEFRVIEPFRVVFSCERTAPERPCNPILDMTLSFSKAVNRQSLAGTKLVRTDGKTWTPEELASAEMKKEAHIGGLTFKGPFPEQSKFKLVLPNSIKDEIGRSLINQTKFPLAVATDEYSPLIKFPATFGILELKADPALPVSVRNVEKQLALQQVAIEGKTFGITSASKAKQVIDWYKRIRNRDYFDDRGVPVLSADQGKKFQLPKPNGEREFELMGIPLHAAGFYVVEMASPRLGQSLLGKGPMYVATAALVTDLAVHFKKGRESSLIWVTSLSDGKPVAGATVSLVDTDGKELTHGTTGADGLFRMGTVEYPCSSDNSQDDDSESHGEHGSQCEVFAFAQKGEDFSFASSDWTKGIESYRFDVNREYLSAQWGPVVMHTVLDRMAAQPGDVVQMKHILREQRAAGFSLFGGIVSEKRLPKRVLVVHRESGKTYTLPFEFDRSAGVAIGTFNIPKDATLGRYTVLLSNKDSQKDSEGGESSDWTATETGSFVVSEYRLPLMKASLKIQGEPLIRPAEVKADLSANYLSGGPAAGLRVKLRASTQAGSFVPDVPGGSGYSFFSTPVKVGISNGDENQTRDESILKVQDLKLGPDGGVLATVRDLPFFKSNTVQRLSLEMEYADPNGEIKTAATQVSVFPAEYVVGLRSDSWYAEPGQVKVMGVIAAINGRPKSGRRYVVEAYRMSSLTHRKRIVGGFYSYDTKYEAKALGQVCEGTTDEVGQFVCQPKGLQSGNVTLQAKVVDDSGRATYAAVGVSVHEAGADSWWTPSDSDRIDLLPEKTRYEPGEKAKFVVRSPFPTSTVLVTVEREGVLDAFVKTVQRDNPTIEVPLKGNYAPNVFVSALAIRGRVGDPQPTALLDLARPAMKMGLTELKVGWKAHELQVAVKTDKNRYRAREKVKVRIEVRTATGVPLPAGSEVAVAAVDESLLRLKENSSWKILKEMMGQRGLAVETSSGQNQVVGRRHFGSKAKLPGGSGGALAADPRDLFEPVLLWQPRVKLNALGEATATVRLNDSLTSFRIVAIATGGENFFGDGAVNIETSKDLIIYSGFAPLVREGDQIKNAFTVRNTTAKAMTVSLDIKSKELQQLPKFSSIELKPSEAKTLDLPVSVPSGLKEISFQIHARDGGSGADDAMTAKVRVEPATPARVLQATLFQLDKSNQVPVRQPIGAVVGRGGLGVHARSTLVTGLAGVKSYMDAYPYSCLEQKISRGIVSESPDEITGHIEALPIYLDAQGLLKFFPSSRCGSPMLTRYVMNILTANGYEIPEATRTKLLAGLTAFVQGQTCQSWWDTFVRDHYSGQEKLLAMETLSRFNAFSPSMLSTVQITPGLWPTEVATAWFSLLKRQPEIANRDGYLKQVESILRSRVSFQGSSMNLQGKLDWEAQWKLFSSQDQEALGVFGISIDEPSWSQDVGRMARGISARLRLGHWDTTMANAWGITQFRRFSGKFEKEKISGETKVVANDVNDIFDWKAFPNGEKKLLNWPTGSDQNNVPVTFTHVGAGKPWIHLETVSAIPLNAPLDMGYKIARKLIPVVQSKPGTWSIGDVANVELLVTAKSDQAWVVVRDSIPAGASHLGTGLDGSSAVLDRAPKRNASAAEVQSWPTEYEEKSHSSFTSYAAYLPRGTYRLNYRVRLNSAGEFKLPQSRAEAMYSPEVFGEVPSASWKVVR